MARGRQQDGEVTAGVGRVERPAVPSRPTEADRRGLRESRRNRTRAVGLRIETVDRAGLEPGDVEDALPIDRHVVWRDPGAQPRDALDRPGVSDPDAIHLAVRTERAVHVEPAA